VLHSLPVRCQEALGYLSLRLFCWPHGTLVLCLEQGQAENLPASCLREAIMPALRASPRLCAWQLTQGSAGPGVVQEEL